ncbi:acyl carrier protein [Pseudomonadota bacterium]
MEAIGNKVKEFIMNEFLPGEDPDQLTESTPLISGGILDSLATLKVVSFLEENFGITVAPHETDEDNFGTIADIVSLVESKQ